MAIPSATAEDERAQSSDGNEFRWKLKARFSPSLLPTQNEMEEGEEKRNHAEEKIEEEKLIATFVGVGSPSSALIPEQLYNYMAVSPDISCFQHVSVRPTVILFAPFVCLTVMLCNREHSSSIVRRQLMAGGRTARGGQGSFWWTFKSTSCPPLTHSLTLPLFQVSLSLVLLLPFLFLLLSCHRPPTVTYDSEPRLVRGVHLCVYTVQMVHGAVGGT